MLAGINVDNLARHADRAITAQKCRECAALFDRDRLAKGAALFGAVQEFIETIKTGRSARRDRSGGQRMNADALRAKFSGEIAAG